MSGMIGSENAMVLLLAMLLGLRHATDPDHLTAVSTLVLSDRKVGEKRALRLGVAWGLGHAVTLFLFGLPAVLFGRYLPDAIQRGIEVAIGFLIVGLAIRLLLRWHSGYFHLHAHQHGTEWHAHPHMHERRRGDVHETAHDHPHAEGLGRSPLAAFAIGLLHGAGGSAGASVLLVGASAQNGHGVTALFLFASMTAVSMAILSGAFGYALGRGRGAAQVNRLIPVLGVFSLLFGVWYAGGTLQLIPPLF
jgi:ABC-type nickel/cobalt efflux system permease component RcnA